MATITKEHPMEKKTFYLTRDTSEVVDKVFVWDKKPDQDNQGNYFLDDENQIIEISTSCEIFTEWEDVFCTTVKRGMQVKLTLEITEAETSLNRAMVALKNAKSTKEN